MSLGQSPVEDAAEDIDAAMFTGDYFSADTGPAARAWLRSMMARWERRMKLIEQETPDDT